MQSIDSQPPRLRSPAAERAFKLFLKDILADPCLHALLCLHLLKTRILSIKIFESLNHRGLLADLLDDSLIQRSIALATAPQPSPQLPTAQKRHDFTVGEPCFFIRNSSFKRYGGVGRKPRIFAWVLRLPNVYGLRPRLVRVDTLHTLCFLHCVQFREVVAVLSKIERKLFLPGTRF